MKRTILVTAMLLIAALVFVSCGEDPFFHYVEFDSNEGTEVERQIVKDGEKAKKPEDPTKTDFVFVEWQLDGKAYDFESPVTANIILKAVWIPAERTVTFDGNKGTLASDKTATVKYNTTIEAPSDPTRAGFIFMGWYDGTTKFDFTTKITEDITLTAKWGLKVTFSDSTGTSPIPDQIVEENGHATKPSDPSLPTGTKKYISAWKKADGTKFMFDTDAVTENITLTAEWKQAYDIGDTGPAGGTIFFDIDDPEYNLDINSYDLGWRYIEAAPSDLTTTYGWGSDGETDTGVGFGDGKSNTEKLLKAKKDDSSLSFPAAEACDTYSNVSGGNTYDDWFLPSYRELDLMYGNLKSENKGGTWQNAKYWSSSEDSEHNAYAINFTDGQFSKTTRNDSSYCSLYVRPVRYV